MENRKTEILQFTTVKDTCTTYIDAASIRSNRKLASGLITPVKDTSVNELAPDHTSEPIKSIEDIYRISDYLLSNKRWRDNMLFIVGINFGLRVSDLRMLKFSNLINDNLTFKDSFPVFEKKTRNTRKKKKNRYITINDAVMEAVTTYLENTPNIKLTDYMFMNEACNYGAIAEPLRRESIDRILKGIARDMDLNIKMSTHTLRKTFAFFQMAMSNNDPRKLLLLQKMLNHSSVAQTLDYIGITDDEIKEAYTNLNLGCSAYRYLINTKVYEDNESVLA